jgi:hypothetical protein
MSTSLDVTRLRSFHQVAEECPALPYNTLRYWYNNRHENGFVRCVVKIYGRTFIDLDQLTNWVKGHRDNPVEHARGETGRKAAYAKQQKRMGVHSIGD